MALVNNLRVQVDKPVWEWARFSPLVSSSVSSSCSPDNSRFHPNNGRYIYYLISATSFWRYDTWTDTYLQLASPTTAPVSWSSMRFAGGQGFRNRVISAAGSTLTAGVFGDGLVGYDVKITGGTGNGQRRVITDVADAVVADSGVVTATATTFLTDTVKNWTVNQWVGYMVRITYGSGVNTIRRIIANSATTILTQDVNQYAYDPDCNSALMSTISATAGSQSFYSIESSVLTVDTPWDVAPDATSRFTVVSGAIYLISGAAAAPFYTFQQYDIVSDTWYVKNATGGILPSVLSDCRLERMGDNASVWERGLATSGTVTTLVDTARQWTTNQWVGYNLRIFSGTGRGSIRPILSNTSNTLTFASASAPDATSYYFIEGFDSGSATSGATTTLTDTTKAWATNRWKNYNLVITDGTGAGQSQTIASNTGTAITVVKAFSTALDSTSKYSIRGDSDKMWICAGGMSQIFHQDLETDLLTSSRQLDAGTARGACAQFSDHPPIAISTATVSAGVVTVNTVFQHTFKTGQSITHRGDTGASSAANNITAIITVTGTATYTYPAPGSTTTWTVTPQSNTTLVDASKSWTTNQWAGYQVTYNTSQGPSASSTTVQIISNTATTLTFATTTGPITGTSRYAIQPRASLGSSDNGIATGTQSTTTLQDTSKNWVVNQWAGKRLRYTNSVGQWLEVPVVSNTANTLTFSLGTAPVANFSVYSLIGVTARGTGLCFEWAPGITDRTQAGRYIFSARGGGLVGFDRYEVPTDTWIPINTVPQTETLTTGSMYAYDGNDRIYFTKETTQRVYYLDLKTSWIHGASIYPYIAGTPILGNRMEIFSTNDGLKYLWLNRHSNLECFLQLCFY